MPSPRSSSNAGKRPGIVISRCLLGDAVRYDGRSKPHPELVEYLQRHCTIIPICPEVEAGLGTPRPPVELVQLNADTTAARGRDDHQIEVSAPLQRATERFIAEQPQLHGALLQNHSPSCGVNDTPLYAADGTLLQQQDGLFTLALRSAHPNLPISSPKALCSRERRALFLRQVTDHMAY